MFNKILNLYNFFDKKHKLKLLYTQLLMLILTITININFLVF